VDVMDVNRRYAVILSLSRRRAIKKKQVMIERSRISRLPRALVARAIKNRDRRFEMRRSVERTRLAYAHAVLPVCV